MPKKGDLKIIAWSCVTMLGVMYAIHNFDALESIKHPLGLDD